MPGSQMEAFTFICYSRRDAAFVADLAARLKQRDCPLWMDQRNLGPGDDWDRAIDAALAGCANLLIVLSPDAVRSGEVRGELRSALNQKKRIVPVLYRPCDIPRQLLNTQYLDASDTGGPTEALLDDLAGALRGEAVRGGLWRDARQAWSPLAYLGARLKTLGASATGGLVLLGITGLLAEASYAHLLGVPLSFSVSRVLSSGVNFFLTLLLEGLFITLPAGAVLLVLYGLSRAARASSAAQAVVARLTRILARPGFLWSAQVAVYLFLFLVSLPDFPRILPLSDLAFGNDLLTARIDSLKDASRHYRVAVLDVGLAALMVAGLEAWRRRLHWKRYHLDRSQELLSLGLALPLYLLVAIELFLLPIGHGLLRLPTRRQHSVSVVTFKPGVRYAELKGNTLLLMDLRPTAPYRFYCPQGSKVFDVTDQDIESYTSPTKGTLAGLLNDFRPLTGCRVENAVPQEVAR